MLFMIYSNQYILNHNYFIVVFSILFGLFYQTGPAMAGKVP